MRGISSQVLQNKPGKIFHQARRVLPNPQGRIKGQSPEVLPAAPGRNTRKGESQKTTAERRCRMNLQDAVLYLRRYQDWRTGLDCRTQKDAGIEPSKLTKAINIILHHHKMGTPLRNCELCGEFDSMFGMCGKIMQGDKCEYGTDVYGTLRMERMERMERMGKKPPD